MRKTVNNDIFKKYFWYQNPSFLAKNLYKANPDKNKQIVNQVSDTLIGLTNVVNTKKLTEIKNSDIVIKIMEKHH